MWCWAIAMGKLLKRKRNNIYIYRIRSRFWYNEWIPSRQFKFARRFDKKKKRKSHVAILQNNNRWCCLLRSQLSFSARWKAVSIVAGDRDLLMNLFEVKFVRTICPCPWGFRVCGSLYLFSDLTQPIVLKAPADPWRSLLKRKGRFVKSATILSNTIITLKFLSL